MPTDKKVTLDYASVIDKAGKYSDFYAMLDREMTNALQRNKDAAATIARQIKRIDLSYFPLKLELSIDMCHPGCVSGGHFICAMHTKDRVTGEMKWQRATEDADKIVGATDDDTLNNIRKFVADVVMHELHECFKVDGELKYDPHNPDKRPSNVRF